jgi:hypothetical protein
MTQCQQNIKFDLLALETLVARHQTVLQEADLSSQRRTYYTSQKKSILSETSLTGQRYCHILVCELNVSSGGNDEFRTQF